MQTETEVEVGIGIGTAAEIGTSVIEFREQEREEQEGALFIITAAEIFLFGAIANTETDVNSLTWYMQIMHGRHSKVPYWYLFYQCSFLLKIQYISISFVYSLFFAFFLDLTN